MPLLYWPVSSEINPYQRVPTLLLPNSSSKIGPNKIVPTEKVPKCDFGQNDHVLTEKVPTVI